MRYLHSTIKFVIRNSHFDLYYLYSSTKGSLYPILYKLSDEGYIISQEDISETKLGRKRIRVIYSITPKGREHLIQLKEEYDIVHDSIRCIFERSKSL